MSNQRCPQNWPDCPCHKVTLEKLECNPPIHHKNCEHIFDGIEIPVKPQPQEWEKEFDSWLNDFEKSKGIGTVMMKPAFKNFITSLLAQEKARILEEYKPVQIVGGEEVTKQRFVLMVEVPNTVKGDFEIFYRELI